MSEMHLLSRELVILKTLDHPNIIKFYETYQDEKYFHLVMEYMAGGDLLSRIAMNNGFIKEENVVNVMYQMFQGVNYIHNQGICHRDLKLENVLFSSKDSWEVKIIDFGLSNRFAAQNQHDNNYMNSMVGTALYVAPEVFNGKYTKKCDIWSLGVIMYILLCGSPPFIGIHKQDVYNQIQKAKLKFSQPIWNIISEEAKNLIKKLINKNIGQRYDSQQALNHPYFKQYNNVVVKKVDITSLERISRFRKMNFFIQDAIKLFIQLVDDHEIQTMKNDFQCLDIDSTGFISKENLITYIKQQNLNVELMDESIENLENNQINYTEYIAGTLDYNYVTKQENMKKIFDYYDIYEDQVLTIKSIKDLMQRRGIKVSKEQVTSWFQGRIYDLEAGICFEQFCHFFHSEKKQGIIQYQNQIDMEQIQEEEN